MGGETGKEMKRNRKQGQRWGKRCMEGKRGTDEELGEGWKETERGEAEPGWRWEKPGDKKEPKEVAESWNWEHAQP